MGLKRIGDVTASAVYGGLPRMRSAPAVKQTVDESAPARVAQMEDVPRPVEKKSVPAIGPTQSHDACVCFEHERGVSTEVVGCAKTSDSGAQDQMVYDDIG